MYFFFILLTFNATSDTHFYPGSHFLKVVHSSLKVLALAKFCIFVSPDFFLIMFLSAPNI